MMLQRLTVLLVALGLLGCRADETAPGAATAVPAASSGGTSAAVAGASAASASASAAAGDPAPDAAALASWKACRERRDEALTLPALAGAPEFEGKRVHMARVRGRALLWRREPKAESTKLAKLAKRHKTSNKLVRAVRRFIRETKRRDARRRHLLREGYLWSDDVNLALALVEQVSILKLFGPKKTLFIQRGEAVFEVVHRRRSKRYHERYIYQDGPQAGRTAEILLGDRIASSREQLESEPSIAIDLEALMARASFDRLRVKHLTEKALVAELRYGPGVWVSAVLELDGAKARVACEALDASLARKKASFVEDDQLLRAAVSRVRKVVRQMVREEIPFDADSGQGNGFLRKAWRRAYDQGWQRFHFGGKRRDVYTSEGMARPPQVCIDFLTDTWERAGGTWFAPLAEGAPKPQRLKGPIDFDKLEIKNRRSVAKFTELALSRTDLFDVWELSKKERIAFKERARFFEALAQNADKFLVGDMLTIHGYKHGGRPHYHSIIVLQKDPITGVPTLVAGNAAIPREQTLEGVMHISPKRSFRHRIRVKKPWLTAVRDLGDAPI